MLIFYRAVMVVAPHGAGGLNLLFSRPPTVFIEVVCAGSSLSFVTLMRNLGHVYYSIGSSSEDRDSFEISRNYCGPMKIDIKQFKETVEFYLNDFILLNT